MDAAVAIGRFLESPGLSDATRRAYRSDLRDFSAWLDDHALALDDVDVRALADYTAELGRARRGLAPATISRRLSAVRALIRHALGPSRVPDVIFGYTVGNDMNTREGGLRNIGSTNQRAAIVANLRAATTEMEALLGLLGETA